jgi:hypothetical protein
LHDATCSGTVGQGLAAETRWHLECTRGGAMDFLFVAATIAFFAVSLAYVHGCERL